MCAAGAAGHQLNIRTGLSIPSLAFVSTSMMSGLVAAAAAIPLIMERIRINFKIEYPGIFLIWLIMVGTLQITKLILLTPYEMPKDKSAIDLYSESQILNKCRNRNASKDKELPDEKNIVSSNLPESISFTSILKGFDIKSCSCQQKFITILF